MERQPVIPPDEQGVLRRQVLAEIAQTRPHLSRAILMLWDELSKDEPMPPAGPLWQFGTQVRDLGELIIGLADALATPPSPLVIDAVEP